MKAVAWAGMMLAGLTGPTVALTPQQMAASETVEILTVPAPSEFFVALDRTVRPDWASFYRDPGPATFPSRSQKAFNLGVFVTDGYVAVEAQDGQQVKNTGREIITLARALGVGEDVLARGKSIADFDDKNDWFALREELEATTNEVRRALTGQRDEALASLIAAGAWLRALQVGSRAALRAGDDEDASGLLAQTELVGFLGHSLEVLPENTRTGPVVTQIREELAALHEVMKTGAAGNDGEPVLEEIQRSTASLVTALGGKEP
jgi:hypothetical protein